MSDDITLAPMSKSEAWDLTDSIRTDLETAFDAIERAKVSIPIAKERLAWQAMGYDSFDDYVSEEFGEVFQALRIKVDDRLQLVDVLSDAGMSNRQIAGTLGVGEATVRRDLRKIDLGAPHDASNQVDAAGQSVEEAVHIEDDEPQPQTVIEHETPREQETPLFKDDNKNEEVDVFAGINFDAMVIKQPTQIIQTEPSKDEPEYFTPRQSAPSWSPPLVQPLPPPPEKAYHDDQPEFLAPPLQIEKPAQSHKQDEKHCKTCACNLLP